MCSDGYGTQAVPTADKVKGSFQKKRRGCHNAQTESFTPATNSCSRGDFFKERVLTPLGINIEELPYPSFRRDGWQNHESHWWGNFHFPEFCKTAATATTLSTKTTMDRAFLVVVAAHFYMRWKGVLPPPFSILSGSTILYGCLSRTGGNACWYILICLVHPYERVHGQGVSTGSVRLKL